MNCNDENMLNRASGIRLRKHVPSVFKITCLRGICLRENLYSFFHFHRDLKSISIFKFNKSKIIII